MIGYSLTPTGKKFMVDMLESYGLKTLSIGDGFNDIPMIHSANIGVSVSNKISGQDFNMDSILKLPLLFAYGNEFCYRNNVISIFTLYKSVSLGFVVFWYLLTKTDEEPALFDFFIYQGFHLVWSLIHPIKYGNSPVINQYYNTKHLLDSKLLFLLILMALFYSYHLYFTYFTDKYIGILLLIVQINSSMLIFDHNLYGLMYQIINIGLYIVYLYIIGKDIEPVSIVKLMVNYVVVNLLSIYSILGLFYRYKKTCK
jgi:magnesium-transporting ATPase (P-type)